MLEQEKRRRSFYDKSQLEELGVSVLIDPQTNELTVFSKIGNKLKKSPIVAKHKYGKDKVYYAYNVAYKDKDTGKWKSKYLLANVLTWVIKNGSVPDNLDVSFKNKDTANFSIDNLELLTRVESLAKRGPGRNQHNAHMSDEEILKSRAIIQEHKDKVKTNTEARKNLEQKIVQLRVAIKSAEDEQTKITLRAKKKSLLRQVDKLTKERRMLFNV